MEKSQEPQELTPEQTGYWEINNTLTGQSMLHAEYFEIGHRAAMRKMGWKANEMKAIKPLKPEPTPKPMIRDWFDWEGFETFSKYMFTEKLNGAGFRGTFRTYMLCWPLGGERASDGITFTFPGTEEPDIFRVDVYDSDKHTTVLKMSDAYSVHPELDPAYRMPVMLSLFEGDEEPLARAHSQQQQMTFKDFVEVLRSSRVRTNDKTSVPMWNAFKFKTHDQIAQELGDEDPKEFYND